MKKFFCVLFWLFGAFLSAEEQPTFKEAEEEKVEFFSPPFAAKIDENPELSLSSPACSPKMHVHYWHRFYANFGMEKIFLRFPSDPVEIRTSNLVRDSAVYRGVEYIFTGFFPPVGNIDTDTFFRSALITYAQPPFVLMTPPVIFQTPTGDWVLDFVAFDEVQGIFIPTRIYVTPFNAYTLQCLKRAGAKDYFDYFLQTFVIKCECSH